MKLLRFGAKGEERYGILEPAGNNIRDISHLVRDESDLYLTNSGLMKKLCSMDLSDLSLVSEDVRVGPPLNSPGKLIFVGFNSQKHALELGIDVSQICEPILFIKPNSSISGPYDPILYGKNLKKLDWEAELAIVIGKQGKYISVDKAGEHIFGYTCCNDLSDRYLQFELQDKQFTKGKCFDGSAVLGPYLVSADEIEDATNLEIKLWVNDELRQDFNTSDYVLNDREVVAFASNFFTLYPGDIISMGSAPGCAGSWGDQYLQPDDKLTLDISSIGRQQQTVILE